MDCIYDHDPFFQAYAQMSRSKQGLSGAGEWQQLKRLFPDLTGKRVLDLGCGYGWHCAYAAACGAASVLGIDASEKMIGVAKARNPAPQIAYRVCDLNHYEYPTEAYDCVISNLVLHYVSDLDGIYRKIYHTLVPGGYFILNIEHPVFTAGVRQEWVRDDAGQALYWPVTGYFSPGERETIFVGERVIKQHHTLTQILMGLLRAGFRIDAVEEPTPPAEMMDLPGMEEELQRPMMLLVRARKEP